MLIFIWVWEFLFSFFAEFRAAKVEKLAIFSILAFFSNFAGPEFDKNENHKNSHTQMKIMHKMLLLTKNEPQWTISWKFYKLLRWKFFIFWAEFPIVKPAKTRKRPNFDKLYLGNRRELREKWAHSEN